MSSFHERQKNLFNLLKDAEEQCNFNKMENTDPSKDYGAIDKQTYRQVKREMRQFRGRESIFKRAAADIRQCLRAKTVPDYIKNPKKWVYYSLSDVTPDQMSDATNTATALALIREMEEKPILDIKEESDQDEFVFKRPTFYVSSTVKKEHKVENDKPIYKNNKVIMPEYVVGVSHKKEKPKNLHKQSTGGADKHVKVELKLNHLYEDEN